MQTGALKKSLGTFCLVVPVLLAGIARAESGAPSVLSRVQTVDDPELAELIRVAVENHEQLYGQGYTDKEVECVQAVTESYAKIKLLDRQVEQIDARLKSAVPPELRHEMILAKAELESKRLVEVAHLRQIMGIIPRYALGPAPVWNLRTWLRLGVVDSAVYVVELLPPFSNRKDEFQIHRPVGVLSLDKFLDYLGERTREKDRLPIRIDIERTSGARALSEDLSKRIVEFVKKGGLELNAEVHLSEKVRSQPEVSSIRVNGSQALLYRIVNGRQVGSDVTSTDDPISELLAQPQNIPAQFRLAYGPSERWETVEQITTRIEEAARRWGLDKYVEVVQYVDKGVPESAWQGRWRTTAEAAISEVAIRRGHTGNLTTKGQTHPIRWTLGGNGIVLRDGDRVYVGNLDATGNLVLPLDGAPVTFKKVE